uniref:Uncharacterized protein n=1 Tax=Ditylenchus dipsaci TaxID=166011 RepID=A0A915D9G5_9BILA
MEDCYDLPDYDAPACPIERSQLMSLKAELTCKNAVVAHQHAQVDVHLYVRYCKRPDGKKCYQYGDGIQIGYGVSDTDGKLAFVSHIVSRADFTPSKVPNTPGTIYSMVSLIIHHSCSGPVNTNPKELSACRCTYTYTIDPKHFCFQPCDEGNVFDMGKVNLANSTYNQCDCTKPEDH